MVQVAGAEALPGPTNPPALDVRKTDVELFKDSCFLILVLLDFFLQEIDWSTVDVWDDVGCPDVRCRYVTGLPPASCQANVVAVIKYLRRSSAFKPSDTWEELLTQAVDQVAARSTPWE